MTQTDIAKNVTAAKDLRDTLESDELDASEMMDRWTLIIRHIGRARAEIEHTSPRDEYPLLVRLALLGHIDRIESSARDLMTRPPK